MKDPRPTDLRTIPFAIPAYWTPEQALAVFELLDDIREVIWNHYSMQLLDEAREQYAPTTTDVRGEVLGDPEDASF
jgi:hypothetical protein